MTVAKFSPEETLAFAQELFGPNKNDPLNALAVLLDVESSRVEAWKQEGIQGSERLLLKAYVLDSREKGFANFEGFSRSLAEVQTAKSHQETVSHAKAKMHADHMVYDVFPNLTYFLICWGLFMHYGEISNFWQMALPMAISLVAILWFSRKKQWQNFYDQAYEKAVKK